MPNNTVPIEEQYKDAVYETHRKNVAVKRAKEDLQGELATLQIRHGHQPVDDHDMRESADDIAKALNRIDDAKAELKRAKDHQKQVGEELRAARNNQTL